MNVAPQSDLQETQSGNPYVFAPEFGQNSLARFSSAAASDCFGLTSSDSLPKAAHDVVTGVLVASSFVRTPPNMYDVSRS